MSMAAKSSGVPSATLHVPCGHIVVAALQYPKLDDKALMDYYKCVDITDMPLLVFNNHKDYDYVTKRVLQALGIVEAPKDEDTLNDAKN